jgi:hypothetical protein
VDLNYSNGVKDKVIEVPFNYFISPIRVMGSEKERKEDEKVYEGS